MRRYPVLFVLGALPVAACAQQDVLSAFVAQSVTHDTNLLRLPAGAAAAASTGSTERGDTVLRTVAGVSFDRQFGLQRVQAGASVDASRYARHEAFDHNGHQAGAAWLWQAGPRWYGDAALRSDRALASFADLRTSQKNLVDRESARLGAGFRVTPAWSLLAATEAVRVTNSAVAFTGADFRETAVEAGARFVPGPAADGALVWRHGSGRLDSGQDPLAATAATGGATATTAGVMAARYTDDRLLLRLAAEPGAISRLAGEIGYTQRRYDSAARQDFRGLTWALDYGWRRGDVFSIGAYLRRDIGVGAAGAGSAYAGSATGAGFAGGGAGAVAGGGSGIAAGGQVAGASTAQLLAANYAETRSAGVRPVWQITGRLRAQGQIDYTERRFDAGATAAVAAARRTDRLTTVGAALDYEVLRKVLLSVYARQERRSSTQAGFGFDARVVGATLEARF